MVHKFHFTYIPLLFCHCHPLTVALWSLHEVGNRRVKVVCTLHLSSTEEVWDLTVVGELDTSYVN